MKNKIKSFIKHRIFSSFMGSHLYIPFERFQTIGGPTTFMQNLRIFLDKKSFKYSKNLESSRGIFFPTVFEIKTLENIKNNGGKIIQRLDGVFYPSKHGNKYLRLNRRIKEIYLEYADFIIFQSEYSRKQCFEMFGKKLKGDYAIIVNGADKKIFYPSKKPLQISNKQIRFVTTGNFRNIDMLEPIIEAFDEIENKYDFEFIIIGPISNNKLEKYLKRKYIRYFPNMTLQEIARELRKSHIFVYSHLNPPCPNSVIEAISCGLPVVGFSSGAMSELLFFNKELLAPVSRDIFQEYEDFNPKKLEEKIILSIKKYICFSRKARKNHLLFTFEKCGSRYIEIFKK